MEYVKWLNFLGHEAKEIPCITGAGAPNTATAAAVGMLYMDINTGELYKCTAAATNNYTWTPVVNVAALENSLRQLNEALASGELKGEKGDPGDSIGVSDYSAGSEHTTVLFTDGSVIQIPNGVGISNIRRTAESETGNTYRIELTNGQDYEFVAPAGPPGKTGGDGAGIKLIKLSEEAETGNTYSVYLTDGSSYDIVAPAGPQGDTGVGIQAIDYDVDSGDFIIMYTDRRTVSVRGPVLPKDTIRIADVELPAAGWQGSGSLYSQVVSIAGVTENSQVDLTPSVEQLVIFYEKDLGFVTENDGGTVTVYAIGQKPENDYTMQVTITEVQA